MNKIQKMLVIGIMSILLISSVYPIIGTETSEADKEADKDPDSIDSCIEEVYNYLNGLSGTSIENPSVIGTVSSSGSFEYGMVTSSGIVTKSESNYIEMEDPSGLASFFESGDGTDNLGAPDDPNTPDDDDDFRESVEMSYSFTKAYPFVECTPFTLGSGAPMAGTFWMRNSGCGSIEYELSENCDWITSVTPSKGVLLGGKSNFVILPDYDGVISGRGQPIDIMIDIDVTGLQAGTYSYPLEIEYIENHCFGGTAVDQPRRQSIPVKITLWGDPTQGPSPRYRILGTESKHAFNVGLGYWDDDSKFSVIAEIWDEGIEGIDSFTTSLRGFELYDLDYGTSASSDRCGSFSLTSPMATGENNIYNGEHRYIKAQISQKSGSISFDFPEIGTYDINVHSSAPMSREPGWVRICFGGMEECGPPCAIPELFWSNPFEMDNFWGGGFIVADVGEIPQYQSASSCFVAWNPVAMEVEDGGGTGNLGAPDDPITPGGGSGGGTQDIGWNLEPTTQQNWFWGDIDDCGFFDWNGEEECPVIIGRQYGTCCGHGSPFGEGLLERLDRVTWDFHIRSDLAVGHYKVPISCVIDIKDFAQDAHGRVWDFMGLRSIVGLEFDVVNSEMDWPPLGLTPEFWLVNEDEISYTIFDIFSNTPETLLFTPLSSSGGWGKHGPLPLPGMMDPSEFHIYDTYPKRGGVEWCQITSSGDYSYNDDFTFADANTGEENEDDDNSESSPLTSKIIGVHLYYGNPFHPHRLDGEQDTPGMLTAPIPINPFPDIHNAFVFTGGTSAHMIKLILEEDSGDDDVTPGDDDIDDPTDEDPTDDDDSTDDPTNEDPTDDDDDTPPADDDSETSIQDLIERFKNKEISVIELISGILSLFLSLFFS